MEVIVKEQDSREPGTPRWFIDPRHRGKTIRALRKTTDGWRNGLSVRGETGDWHPLVSLNIAGPIFRFHEGDVQHIRLHSPNTLVDFGTPLRCPPTSLYAAFDRLIDGVVVRADDVPLVAFGGPGLRGIPWGLRYLSTAPGMSPDLLQAIVSSEASRELIGIDLTGCEALRDLESISALSNLTTLRITRCANLANLEALGRLRRLRTLVLSQCQALRSIEPVALPDGIRELRLDSCPRVRDHRVIGTLVRLKALQVSSVPFNPTLLRELTALERLSLKAVDLQEQEAQGRELPLHQLPMLRELDLFDTNWPANADALLCLPRLRSLRLGHNRRIRSVAPLARLEELQELCLSGCYRIGDLDELERAPSLRKLKHYDLAAAARIVGRCSARRGDLSGRHAPTFDWCDLAHVRNTLSSGG